MTGHEQTSQVVAGHEHRLAQLDPLLPRAHPLPAPADGDAALAARGAVGLARREAPDPDSLEATWGAAVRHRLLARVTEPDPATAMGALLDRWRAAVVPQVSGDDADVEAGITWPSRDTAMNRQFLDCGLVPGVVVGARPAGRPSPEAPAGVQVRPLQEPDLDEAQHLWLELVRWDAQFSSLTERSSTAPGLRRELATEATHDPSWVWVAEHGGALTGMVMVTPPARAGWVAPLTSGSPAAYLGAMVVTAGRRGGGTGAALVRHAHATLDAAGVGVTLLHYTAMNPLSVPFWHRCGYRPLWTSWHAYPASRLARA